MTRPMCLVMCLLAGLLFPALGLSQESELPAAESAPAETPGAVDPAASEQTLEEAQEHLEAIAKDVDQDPNAQKATAGILKPIYLLAEQLAFPSFHWVAFALMTAGVIGFAFQLVLAKLVVLGRLSFSLREILSDALGLAISLVGLVLTTQAAAENSDFTEHPAAVLSATIVGALVGFLHYRWGQSQELEAADGRKRAASKPAT